MALTTSFVMLSDPHQSDSSNSLDDSDDEIVYSVSSGSLLSRSTSDTLSDDDFVVLSRPRSSISTVSQAGLSTPSVCSTPDGVAELTHNLADFKLDAPTVATYTSPRNKSKKTRKPPLVVTKKKSKTSTTPTKKTTASQPFHRSSFQLSKSPALLPPTTTILAQRRPEKPTKAIAYRTIQKAATAGLGARSIVDDASERYSECDSSDIGSLSMYDEAVGYITSFLSNPAARKDSACRLTLLQALIIELGLASSSLPASLTSARAFLKSHAFLNIREYLAVREQGPAAVQNILHPNRTSLIKDIRKNKKRAPLDRVKESGLQVLLVQCYH